GYHAIPRGPDTVSFTDQFYCIVIGMYWCCKRYSYLCKGKNQCRCNIAMPGGTKFTGIHDLPYPDFSNWFHWLTCRCIAWNPDPAGFANRIKRLTSCFN